MPKKLYRLALFSLLFLNAFFLTALVTFHAGRASPGGATDPEKLCQSPVTLTNVPEVSAKSPMGNRMSA